MMQDSPVLLPRTVGRARRFAPVLFVMIGLCGLLQTLLGSNTELSILGYICAGVLVAILCRENEAPTLLFIFGYQWLQAFSPVFQADLDGQPVSVRFANQHYEKAVIYSLLGVLATSSGAALAAKWIGQLRPSASWSQVASLRAGRAFSVWLASFCVVSFFPAILQIGGLRQILQPIFQLACVALELLILQHAMLTGRALTIVGVIIATELIMGLTGFFSGFRQTFHIVILAALGLISIRPRLIGLISIATVILVTLSLFWSTIKQDYRDFVSQGSAGQTVLVSFEERVRFLWIAVQEASPKQAVRAMDDLLTRVGYVTFFSHSIETVPQEIPHTNGRLWKEAVMHVLMPRVLFPNKPELNDSDRTNEFTGVTVAGVDQGTSIGIGYIGESYIDFGFPLMLVPLVIFGLLLGGSYGGVVRCLPDRQVGVAAGSALLLGSSYLLESSNAKMLGSLVAGAVVYLLFLKTLGPKLIQWFFEAGMSPNKVEFGRNNGTPLT